MALRPMGKGDLDEVIKILNSDPRLAFQDWEAEILRQYAEGINTDLSSYLGILNGEIVGLVFFGQSGEKASINHIWVAERHRGLGVSTQLLNSALKECSGKTVHLMTVNGNADANAFFASENFTRGNKFFEMDIESSTGQICDEQSLLDHVHILGLRALLQTIPEISQWEGIKRALYAKGIRRIHFIPPFGFSDTDILITMGFKQPKGENLWIKKV